MITNEDARLVPDQVYPPAAQDDVRVYACPRVIDFDRPHLGKNLEEAAIFSLPPDRQVLVRDHRCAIDEKRFSGVGLRMPGNGQDGNHSESDYEYLRHVSAPARTLLVAGAPD